MSGSLVVMSAVAPSGVCMLLAYIGPGAGLTVLGAALALLFGIFLVALGFVWYPFKRILRSVRKPKKDPASSTTEDTDVGWTE